MKRLLILFLVTIVSSQNELQFLQDYNYWSELVKNNLNSTTFSDSCKKQFEELLKHDLQDVWNLFDATAKFPWSGLATGSYFDWGNYDQCIKIRHDYTQGSILGKYCVHGLLIPSPKVNMSNPQLNDFYKLGLCMPDACTAADYNELVNVINLGYVFIFQDQACHTKDDLDRYSWQDITMVVVLAIFAFLMVVSTMYDVYLKLNKKKSIHPICVAFSVYTNGRKIIQTSKNNREQIQIFNGIKTISMAWVIAGHGMGGWNNFSVTNNDDVEFKAKHTSTFYVSGAKLAVDTFFYMSGFLLAYTYIKQKSKPLVLHIKQLPYLVLHRYIRLTPAVAMLFFVFMSIFGHLGSGPLWVAGMDEIRKPCRSHWLPFFLYAQNYVNKDDICIIPTWYLSADMQLFLLSVLILIPLTVLLNGDKSNFKRVMIICLGLNVFFTLVPLVTQLVWPDYKNEYDTHTRVIDYTMGIMMGIFIRERKEKPFLYGKISKPGLTNFLIWILILAMMGVLVVFYQVIIISMDYSDRAVAGFYTICRPLWCLGLSWMVYSSYHGYGGIVNWILVRPTLQITAKLSYCMYLIHGLVITHATLITRERLFFSDWVEFNNWCAYFIVSFVIAFIWSLAFESPLIIIEKLIFGGATPRKSKPKNKSEDNKNTHEDIKSTQQYVQKEAV
ncbi:unnamed protein product [Diabrotica balteata]|uniref:Nose resistant-to-fluoxetine protein N-terminal domain-containing protein n=1 Tax=Diabrotica balteata TaxID=107213 RepID=A0A9N9X469_DIABA|nr:unnamed protein product [Diabrotica balteata]